MSSAVPCLRDELDVLGAKNAHFFIPKNRISFAAQEMLDATAFEVFGAGQVEGGAAVDVLDIQVDG